MRTLPLLGLCSLTLLTGCSGDEGFGGVDRKPTHKVTGTVTLAGGAVAGASVTFSPSEGQPVAYGLTDTAGNYSLTTYDADDGAVAGKYVVLVTKSVPAAATGPASHEAFVAAGGMGNAHQEASAAAKKAGGLPEKYSKVGTSGLAKTVEADKENVIPIELTP